MIRLSVQGSRWHVSGSLGADSCASFCELLRLASESNQRAGSVLDLSELESIDMKGVQVLASFLATSPENRIVAPSAAVRDFLRQVGALSRLVGET
ncbi:MAG: STAS domain-containing protein [Myxococcota bacterium]